MGGCFSRSAPTASVKQSVECDSSKQDTSKNVVLTSGTQASKPPSSDAVAQRHAPTHAPVSSASGTFSATSSGPPSTRQSDSSLVSTATPTTVLPAASSRTNPIWNHSYYLKVGDLRVGASGSVQLAVDLRFGTKVAIKFIDRGSSSVQIAAREVLNQRLCFHHPHIIQFREIFLTPEYLAIVSEYAAGGDLADYIDRHQAVHKKTGLPEATALWLFQQLVTGVNFCHQMGIANRDIKLENTLLMDDTEHPLLKLCDFGYSKDEYQGSACKTLCGTPEYVAPEVLSHESYDGKAADVWSCGVVLYTLLTGRFPFRETSEDDLNPVLLLQRMFPRILSGAFKMPSNVSPECQDLLTAMLKVDPARRIPAIRILQHPWLAASTSKAELAALQRNASKPLSDSWAAQTDQQIMRFTQEAAKGHAKNHIDEALPY